MSINVLIADDSAFVRKVISDILLEDEKNKIIIIDQAKDGRETVEKVKEHNPDVLLLDLVMPKMNGLDAFEKIMNETPTTTIILSAISPQNMDVSIQALLMGAFDYVIKPGGLGAKDLPNFRKELLNKVLLASKSQIRKILKEQDLLKRKTYLRQELVSDTFEFGKYLKNLKPVEETDKKGVKKPAKVELKPKVIREEIKVKPATQQIKVKQKNKTEVSRKSKIQKAKSVKIKKPKEKIVSSIPDITPIKGIQLKNNVIVIGASVGGPRTIRNILKEIPKQFTCPILIVQHLNANFIQTFVNTLNNYSEIKIKIAENGEIIQPGNVYIAPGDRHMEISTSNRQPCIKTYVGAPIHHCIPSIDVLFSSAAKVYRKSTMGILLTGMGEDGVVGLGAIKKVGGVSIAESEQTSVVYGMPKLAAERGAANVILPYYDISNYMIKFANYSKK